MAILKINENPTISDTIVFEITTKDIKNCNLFTPYKINSLVIYYVERNFSGGNTKQYNQSIYDENKLAAAKAAEIIACNDPTEANIQAARAAKHESESNISTNPFFFNDAKPVHVVGNSSYPAWLATDLDNAFLELVDTGSFTYTWEPQGMREGDYFICWTWTPLAAGDNFSDHLKFSLIGDTQVTTSIPTHFTDPKKYETLLERYTPEMFKMLICPTDRTPDVLDKLNKSIALGFNTLENLTNQIVDLQDANSIHEALIPNLSNLFGLKLKTEDPTKWRGQIKRAVPLNKMKGTKKALLEAMEQAGASVLKFDQLWQIISSYTWQQEFKFNEELSFILEKNALPIDEENFELWMKPVGESWIELSSDYVEFSTDDEGNSVVTWIGGELEIDPIDLIAGDKIRILYLIREVPDETAQNLETYIRLLPLMDQRDDGDQEYPPKNWNVRLIAKDDPLFSLVVPDRNPFHDFLIYGQVRTEFPYSENIYNMDEYNGCCVGETTVITENGLKKIKDISNDNSILTEFGFKKFESLQNQGKRKTLCIKTKLGNKLQITPNHRFKILNKEGIIEWKTADSLNVNDYILGKKGGFEKIPKKECADKDVWYLIGHIYGDGGLSFSKQKKLQFSWLVSETEPEIKSFIESVLKTNLAKFNVFERLPEKHQKFTDFKCKEKIYLIRSSAIQFNIENILPKYEKKGNWKKNLPKNIWTASEEQACAFLRGLFDTDGGMQGKHPLLTTKWHSLAKEVQQLLLLIGINSSVTSYNVKWKKETRKYFRVRIIGENGRNLFIEKINFLSLKKKQKLEKEVERSILFADRMIIPNACDIIRSIFNHKKRISKNKVEQRNNKEKRILTLLTRLKQGYQTTIPDNLIDNIIEKAEEFGNKNENLNFLKDYKKNNWFFDKIISIEDGVEEDVFDPINVAETESYLSEGLVSHNSIRNSKNPCDIDKSFVDPCSACVSSCYNIDVEIENLADDRIQEVKQVLKEYTPFHSILHTLNFIGGINEFFEPPTEEIEILITYFGEDFMIAGDGQTYFNRIMKLVETNGILRSELADSFEVLSATSATAYNDYIVVFCPEIELEDLGIAKNGTASLEIKSPSSLAGEYSVDETSGNTIKLTSGSLEPIDNCNNFFDVDGTLNSCAFVFDINNPIDAINGTLCNILQDNQYTIKKQEEDFGLLGVKTLVDVEDGDAVSAYQILIPAYRVTAYDILDILPNGDLVIKNENDGTLPASSASSVAFTIKNGLTTVLSSTSDLIVRNRGLVTALNSNALPIQNTLTINENCYQKISGEEYLITEFKDTDKYFIENYQGGSTNGVTILINQKIVKEKIGYLSHRGINLKIAGNIEQSLGIQNGTNSYVVTDDGIENDGFKENFIVLVDGESYWIKEIDGLNPTGFTTINLSGTDKYWKTLSAGGTTVTVSIYQYSKNGATIDGQRYNLPEHTFRTIDRSGQPVITGILDTEEVVMSLSNNDDNFVDTVQQTENVSFTIEYDDGTTEERTI